MILVFYYLALFTISGMIMEKFNFLYMDIFVYAIISTIITYLAIDRERNSR
jgi:hypothetical protein